MDEFLDDMYDEQVDDLLMPEEDETSRSEEHTSELQSHITIS